MGICISCGEVSVIDVDGQCQVCYQNKITVDRFGKTIDKLVKKHRDEQQKNFQFFITSPEDLFK